MKLFQDKYFIFLAICIFISAFYTFRFLTFQTIFGYDMARDAFYAHDILFNHNIKILGPTTDVVGLNHGVLWYYFLVIPYFLAFQDPQLTALFFFLLAIATIPFVWILSFRLFKDRTISFVSTVLYSFSPIVVAFTSWMSNPILGLYISPALLILIYDFVKKQDRKKSFLIGLLYGILVQAELASLLLLPTVIFYLLFFKIKLKFLEGLSFLAGITIALSTYFISEIVFKGRAIFSLINYLQKGHGSKLPDFGFLANRINEFFQITVTPFGGIAVVGVIVIFIIGLLTLSRKDKKSVIFLLIWLSNIVFFTLFDTGISHSHFVFIPSIAADIILFSFVFCRLLKNKILIILFVFLIVLMQISKVEAWIKDDFSPASIQKSNSVRVYKKVVDFTYQTSSGESFIINTVTNPLFINTNWEYLYEFYGKKKYGYSPFFGGRSQEGYLHALERKQFGTRFRYLIIESTIGMPEIYVTKAIYEEEKVSDLIEEKKFGYVVVQKRIFHEGKKDIEIPQSLKNSPVLYE